MTNQHNDLREEGRTAEEKIRAMETVLHKVIQWCNGSYKTPPSEFYMEMVDAMDIEYKQPEAQLSEAHKEIEEFTKQETKVSNVVEFSQIVKVGKWMRDEMFVPKPMQA